VRVAVVRHQGETTLAPSNDVVPYLKAQGDGRWLVSTFDERDFGGALGAQDFDVIVLGYNAILFTPELRAALRATAPSTPLLLMHQRDTECFDFLQRDLALELVKLGDGVTEAVSPRERAPEFEPVLNWPNAATVPLAAKAIRGYAFSPSTAWRVVLEVQLAAQRLPAVIRTRADHPRRIVALSLLLRPAVVDAHGELLENLLVYCAFGWPDVALVTIDRHAASAGRVLDLERGMGMWTERRVSVTVPNGKPLPVGQWPLIGVKRIVAPKELAAKVDKLGGTPAWSRRGGELIRVDADRNVTVTAQLTDQFVVLRHWAVWFSALPERAWIGRLSPARSVLRLLATIEAELGELSGDLRFKLEPSDYAPEIARLLAGRVRHGNVDETISATAAALDLDSLTGARALTRIQRQRMRSWLRQQIDGATRADQLDILRVLGDRELLAERLKAWEGDWLSADADRRLDVLVATRLREAVHACWPEGDEPHDLLADTALAALDGDDLVNELHRGPLQCADFLAAVYSRGPEAAGAGAPLFDPARFPRSIGAATERVGGRGLYTADADVRAVCAHTLAVLRHLERHPAGLRFLPGHGELPQSAVESVLQEATRAREAERDARRDLPALGVAVFLLATVALAFGALGLLDLWGISGITLVVPWWLALSALALAAGGLAGLRWFVLERAERAEERDLQLAQHAVAAAAVALALVPATLVWQLAAPESGVLAVTFGPVAGLIAFVLLMIALNRFGLAPGWATSLPSQAADVKSLPGLLAKLIRPRS
jgi:hypothetical protein